MSTVAPVLGDAWAPTGAVGLHSGPTPLSEGYIARIADPAFLMSTRPNQTLNTLWLAHSNEEFQERQRKATLASLVGIGPRDELEGMIAAQLLAAHHAAMECYRRAIIPEQSFEGRRENLSQANKLSRTYTTLLEALNRHRGKSQQKVTVEHVHVHAGGQAVVGTVESQGGGGQKKSEDQPHAKQIAHAPQPSMWGSDAEGQPVSVTGDAERPMPHARRKVARRSRG